jgi:glycosyltransferase involved in cell wall biosynthesis
VNASATPFASCGEVLVVVLAHNEERRIGACLKSLLAEPGGCPIHVAVNGSQDRTAEIAAGFGPRVAVHVYDAPGKARSWNRLVLDELPAYADCNVFVDGDAVIAPGSLAALARMLRKAPAANAAAGLPLNGRRVHAYQADVVQRHAMFGDLYALSGPFLSRMKAAGVRLPDDLIGDDGLLGALAKTDLEGDDNWDDARLAPCPAAGFYCEPVRLTAPASWRMQHRRMVNYSVRHFQNRIISDIMRGPGPRALPRRLATLYPAHLAGFVPRPGLASWWFDRLALARMRQACGAAPGCDDGARAAASRASAG